MDGTPMTARPFRFMQFAHTFTSSGLILFLRLRLPSVSVLVVWLLMLSVSASWAETAEAERSVICSPAAPAPAAADASAFGGCDLLVAGGDCGLRSRHVNWCSSGVNSVCVMYVKSCVTLSSSPYESVRSSAQSFCSFCVRKQKVYYVMMSSNSR